MLYHIDAESCRFVVFMLLVAIDCVRFSARTLTFEKKNCKLNKMHRFYRECELHIQLHNCTSHFGHRKVRSLGSEAIRFVFALEKIQLSLMWKGTKNFKLSTLHVLHKLLRCACFVCQCLSLSFCVCAQSFNSFFILFIQRNLPILQKFSWVVLPFLVHHHRRRFFLCCYIYLVSVCHFSLECTVSSVNPVRLSRVVITTAQTKYEQKFANFN